MGRDPQIHKNNRRLMDTYARLLDTLAALVADGELTEEQAAGILVNWQQIAGLETMIPLPTAAGVQAEEDDDGAAAEVIAEFG